MTDTPDAPQPPTCPGPAGPRGARHRDDLEVPHGDEPLTRREEGARCRAGSPVAVLVLASFALVTVVVSALRVLRLPADRPAGRPRRRGRVIIT